MHQNLHNDALASPVFQVHPAYEKFLRGIFYQPQLMLLPTPIPLQLTMMKMTTINPSI